MKLYRWEIFRWFMKTPHRSLERAYRASKRIQYIRKDYSSYKNIVLFSRGSWQATTLYMNTEFRNTSFIIYWSLLEYRISLCFLNSLKKMESIKLEKFIISFKALNLHLSLSYVNKQLLILSKETFDKMYFYFSKNVYFSFFIHNCLSKILGKGIDKLGQEKLNSKNKKKIKDETFFFLDQSFEKDLNRIRQMNRKLAWIEVISNDLNIWKSYYPFFHSLSKKENIFQYEFFSNLKNFEIRTLAYEFTGFIPRSISRTLSRFQMELMGRSSSLVLQEFRLAKHQALASIQYMGCLIFFPWIISFYLKEWLLKPWIHFWWDAHQYQIFLNSFQEERVLEGLQEVEELLWLDKLVSNLPKTQSQDLEIHKETIQLIKLYNENSIQTILNLLTGIVCFTILGASFILGKKRLSILNSWIRESFYSLSDTMKAFVILLLTDLCIGFHSPHGWEIVIGYFLEHLGFAHNKHVISCFVSTFPVILDTVSKYWIFRHLNRISPSIVATYHTMNE
uniref:Potassium/proton antiporter CemA n=1 Tax=Leiosporoceros dussii TaxID=263836 RepID=A0A385KDN5_9EMBR|nr:chloroplast enveloppe membrane protein [Leiosporoceros dussii]AXZ70876.1 chloroplast enveloppe membrane protein [Leiosporoceros dussii]